MTRLSIVVATAVALPLAGGCVASSGPSAPVVAAGLVLPWPEASRNLADALKRVTYGPTNAFIVSEQGPISRIRVRPDHFSFLDVGTLPASTTTSGKAEAYRMTRTFAYNTLGGLHVHKLGPRRYVDLLGTEIPAAKNGWGTIRTLLFASEADALNFVRAVHDVIRAAPYASRADDDFARLAESFRAANPKPALSESANRHRVLAEAATRDKDFDAAVEHFEAALETDPTWPSGNFNLALVYEALEDWSEAARYMKRFLLLEPNSREAGAARDKLIVWEDRASRQGQR